MRTPRNLKFSQPLEPEDVSQAWDYLFSLPLALRKQEEPPLPPEHLQNLSDSDWFLLNSLLAQELQLRDHSPVH
jgi:hypothetical protein